MNVRDLYRPWWTLRRKNAHIPGGTTITLDERLPELDGERIYIVSESQMEGMRLSLAMSWAYAITFMVWTFLYLAHLI